MNVNKLGGLGLQERRRVGSRNDIGVEFLTESGEPGDKVSLGSSMQGRLGFVEQDHHGELTVLERCELYREACPASLGVAELIDAHFRTCRVDRNPRQDAVKRPELKRVNASFK